MERYSDLAIEVLNLAEIKLLSQLRFLSGAVMSMKAEEFQQDILFASDGKRIYYNPVKVLEAYKEEKNLIVTGLLHILLHCLMGHPFSSNKNFSGKQTERSIWNVACDMAVENARIEMSQTLFPVREDETRKSHLDRISDYAGGNTAEAYYNYFLDYEVSQEELTVLERLLYRDNHSMWITVRHSGGRSAQGKTVKGSGTKNGKKQEEEELLAPIGTEDKLAQADMKKLTRQWKKIAKQVKTDLEIFHRKQGIRAGALMNNLKAVLFEEVDYTEFLRIFGTENEVMRISDDEFDVIYYTYGLEKYHNIPLIEPMEFCNDSRIKEFVIAIDTSGSVQGETVEDFLRHTCGMLRQKGRFTQQVNIYILQCDCAVQNIARITDLKELDYYIANLSLAGFGGTDFRPVFDYVEQLQREKKLQNINGLLYFTDGVGIYPAKNPPYKTAFIFNRDDYITPNVPEWAIKAVLTSDNIKMMKDR